MQGWLLTSIDGGIKLWGQAGVREGYFGCAGGAREQARGAWQDEHCHGGHTLQACMKLEGIRSIQSLHVSN